MESPTTALAKFASELEHSDMPNHVIKVAENCFLDWLGSALIGSRARPARYVFQIVESLGGALESTIIAYGKKTCCINAALVNGVMSHIEELDDVHNASLFHPGASIIPAALSTAEREGADGRKLILAIVAGYDAAIRIGEAVNPSHYKYWHTTGTCGTFGAAIASGKILDLDTAEMVNALGNAGTQAAGLWEFASNGSMSKHLHPGKAAANGVFSALLAQKGFTGASTILEGERGFCKAMSERYDLSRIGSALGKHFKISEVSFKPYASCRHSHSMIDAILQIRHLEEIRPDEVEKIRVKTYSVAAQTADKISPRTPFEAKFSLWYCAAVALKYGKVTVDEFGEDVVKNPDIQSLMKKVEVRIDAELNRQHPGKWPAKVEIQMKNGASYSTQVEFPLGDPENPMKDKDLRDKFRVLASNTLGSKKAENIVDSVAELDRMPDVRELVKLLH